MKYWGLLAAKLAAAAVVLPCLWAGLTTLLPAPRTFLNVRPVLGRDLVWTLAACVFFVFACGVLYLCFLDQRYRCRVCLRRLRMPVETGSWDRMLQFGRPRIEYICIYGHGTLQVPEARIAGLEWSDWKPHRDPWKELLEIEENSR